MPHATLETLPYYSFGSSNLYLTRPDASAQLAEPVIIAAPATAAGITEIRSILVRQA